MKSYQLAMDLTGETMISSSPEDSPANHTQVQGRDLGKLTSDISSRRCLESFLRLSQPTSWAKMFMVSLIGMGEWSSKRCVLTWRVLGTKYNRYYCQLRASVRHTTECEFGLLPTPTAMNRNITQEQTEKRHQIYGGNTREMYLENFAVMGMLPTPNAYDWNTPRKEETFKEAQQKHKEKGVNLQNPLKQMASMGMLPTPTTRDHKSGQSPSGMRRKNGKSREDQLNNLPVMLGKHTQQTGMVSHQLNPQFVAEMMGFPTDWTELPFLSGDNSQ